MSALQSMTQRDGRWYGMTPGQHVAVRKVYANVTRRAVWHGRAQRFDLDTKKWVVERCPHGHNKKSAARQCGEAAARRLNKEVTV